MFRDDLHSPFLRFIAAKGKKVEAGTVMGSLNSRSDHSRSGDDAQGSRPHLQVSHLCSCDLVVHHGMWTGKKEKSTVHLDERGKRRGIDLECPHFSKLTLLCSGPDVFKNH